MYRYFAELVQYVLSAFLWSTQQHSIWLSQLDTHGDTQTLRQRFYATEAKAGCLCTTPDEADPKRHICECIAAGGSCHPSVCACAVYVPAGKKCANPEGYFEFSESDVTAYRKNLLKDLRVKLRRERSYSSDYGATTDGTVTGESDGGDTMETTVPNPPVVESVPPPEADAWRDCPSELLPSKRSRRAKGRKKGRG